MTVAFILARAARGRVGTMSPWKSLYAMTWLMFLEVALVVVPGRPAALVWAHAALGAGLVALAVSNHRSLRATAVPGRVKRTAQSTMQLTVVLAALGLLLVFDVGKGLVLLGVTAYAVVVVLHVILALTVFAQAAATGIAYDMWEEKEFLAETKPGEIPPPATQA